MARISHLCDLTTSSLLSFLESKPSPLTKEFEKQILLSLSREIRQWGTELNCTIDLDKVDDSHSVHNCLMHLEQPLNGDCKCLANIISIMVAFMSYDSRYVQHLAGNILFAISNSLINFENIWVEFLQLIWFTLDAAMSHICGCTSSGSAVGSITPRDKCLMERYSLTKNMVSGIESLSFDTESFVAVLQLRSASMSWQMVAGLFRLLRNILKSLKHDYGELEDRYLHLAVPFLQRMPWNLIGKINVSEVIRAGSDKALDKNNGSSGFKGTLSGAILQLFCSLIEQKGFENVKNALLDEHFMYSKLGDLIPELLSCFCNQLGGDGSCLSIYLRHKMLMLMIRVSSHMRWQSSRLVSWLKFLRQYFQDLLCESISESVVDSGSSLEGSPFLSSIAEGLKVYNSCTRHLQRQAIFLLFKCCFMLARINDVTRQQCSCSKEASSFACESQLCSDCCSHIGLSEISEWLQKCGQIKKYGDHESSLDFALSFLDLYMEEDDMLFGMLLELLDAPFLTIHMEDIEKKLAPKETTRDAFSAIFNPVFLFHLFLSLLHFDHLVLVDYLISKDTGVLCAQYLLRCLRVISRSWCIFVNFSISDTAIKEPCYKRQKIFTHDSNFKGNLDPSASAAMVAGIYEPEQKFGSITQTINLQPFQKAKECLLSLKKTLEDLQRKNLFPYNPKPLLRSLSRFEELCEQ
ncbi:uncharacterized protein [Typha latifolia]|uniref:uncharacterized protein isoform X2 n=1 Tax=Typha latifolia TaxID=4733 RepID=UPI003C2DFA7E